MAEIKVLDPRIVFAFEILIGNNGRYALVQGEIMKITKETHLNNGKELEVEEVYPWLPMRRYSVFFPCTGEERKSDYVIEYLEPWIEKIVKEHAEFASSKERLRKESELRRPPNDGK